MKSTQLLLLAGLALGTVSSLAMAAPPAGETLNPGVVTQTGGLTPLTPEQRRGILGPCRADLSVQSLEISRRTPAGPLNLRAVVRNIGTEAFDAPPAFTGFVFGATHGGSAQEQTFAAGDISRIAPGATRTFTIVMPRTVFDQEFYGEARGFVVLGPDAPRCGMEMNANNNVLGMTNEQVRLWLNGTAPSFTVRR